MKLVTCPACSAQLFVDASRAPICGKCGAPVSTVRRKNLLVRFFRRLFARTPVRRPRSQPAQARPHVPAQAAIGADLKRKLDTLAGRAWGARGDIEARQLDLRLDELSRDLSREALVRRMLQHVRAVAPALDVPMLTPRVTVEPVATAAGLFVEEDGWVKVVVSANFFDNWTAAVAILCHELCHYMLNANGIREQPTLENERLTDAAMFAFGLGAIFLECYQRHAGREYRAGHRVGYLTDAEFRAAHGYVHVLRRSEEFLRAAKGRRDDWVWDRSLR